jgi:hypothetical protein
VDIAVAAGMTPTPPIPLTAALSNIQAFARMSQLQQFVAELAVDVMCHHEDQSLAVRLLKALLLLTPVLLALVSLSHLSPLSLSLSLSRWRKCSLL